MSFIKCVPVKPATATVTGFTGNVILLVLVFFLITIIAGLVIFWLNLALIKSLGEAIQNQKVESILSALKSTGPLYMAAFGASLLTGILVFFGTLLLIIPGIIFAVWYLFTIYIVIFEKKDATEAMQSSKALVVGRWWGITWRAVVPQVLFIVILVVLQILIMLPLSFLQGAKIFEVIDIILSILVSAIFTPLSTLAILVLYFNVRENPVMRESSPSKK
jgi:uncharacterized membrane protein